MIDTEVSGETANSYIEVDEAEELILAAGLVTDRWTALDDLDESVKEWIIQLGATMIGLLPLRGRRTTLTQALDFPRWLQDYTEALPIGTLPDSAYEIPDAVKLAQALMSCLVVEPNFNYQLVMNENEDSPTWMQNASVKQIQVAGIMTVKLGTETNNTGGAPASSNKPASLINIYGLPIYMVMKPFLSQIRGGSLKPLSEDYYRNINNLPDYDSHRYTPWGWARV